jgi:cytochrome c biogenesis protein CcmG, thiol:disulfide interchange protein DsbE
VLNIVRLSSMMLAGALLLSGCTSQPTPATTLTTTPAPTITVPTTTSTPPAPTTATTTATVTVPPTTTPPVTTTPPPPPSPLPSPGTNIGNLANDFQLTSLDGKVVLLSGLRGKPVLLNFWATWCPPCKAEMPLLQQIYDKYTAQGLVLLEVDVGETASVVKSYLASNNLSLPVVLDTDRKVTLSSYGVASIPTSFFIDKNGVIQQKFIGAYTSLEQIETQLKKIMP